jgi:hypothetical protein
MHDDYINSFTAFSASLALLAIHSVSSFKHNFYEELVPLSRLTEAVNEIYGVEVFNRKNSRGFGWEL